MILVFFGGLNQLYLEFLLTIASTMFVENPFWAYQGTLLDQVKGNKKIQGKMVNKFIGFYNKKISQIQIKLKQVWQIL